MGERNWAGNHEYRANPIHYPNTIDELRTLVATCPKVRALGSRHSFTGIADSAEIVCLRDLPDELELDPSGSTVTISAYMTYGRLVELLRPLGIAIHNLASLPHISVAGAVATGTHGSGTANGNLGTSVSGIELLTSSGDFVRVRTGEVGFDGMVVAMGALGVVTRLVLDVEPAFSVQQRVYERLSWDVLDASFDEVFSSGYSVSAFSRFGEYVDQVWVKRRSEQSSAEDGAAFFGAPPATTPVHPVPGGSADSCTEQLGIAGLWSDRLPHFRLGFAPSSGSEIQSEFFVGVEDAPRAISALRAVQPAISDALLVGEIRTVAADRLWLSPHYRRDSVAFHFTWRLDQDLAEHAAAIVADALEPFGARPHWGKVFPESGRPARHYERLGDFVALADTLDPRHAFRNDWLERVIFGV